MLTDEDFMTLLADNILTNHNNNAQLSIRITSAASLHPINVGEIKAKTALTVHRTE